MKAPGDSGAHAFNFFLPLPVASVLLPAKSAVRDGIAVILAWHMHRFVESFYYDNRWT